MPLIRVAWDEDTAVVSFARPPVNAFNLSLIEELHARLDELADVTAGIPYPACPMEVVRAEIEPGYRRHLVLSGELIDPHEARARGLVDDVVVGDELLARAVQLARARAAAPAYAVVKEQLKRHALARMREVIATRWDPLLDGPP